MLGGLRSRGRLIELTGDVPGLSRNDAFAGVVLPHLDAAYNLARWLLRDSTTGAVAIVDPAPAAAA